MVRLNGKHRKIVEYFNKKKYYNSGFLKYNSWYNRMNYLLGDDLSRYEKRKLFVDLVELKYFNSRKLKIRSYVYEFINKKKQECLEEPFDGVVIIFE